MVDYYLGNVQFTKELNRPLIQTIGIALNMSLAMVVVAWVILAVRGKPGMV
jgi:hypothetical protein